MISGFMIVKDVLRQGSASMLTATGTFRTGSSDGLADLVGHGSLAQSDNVFALSVAVYP